MLSNLPVLTVALMLPFDAPSLSPFAEQANTLLHSPLCTGVLWYGTGLIALDLFEKKIVPRFGLRSILPVVKDEFGLTREERQIGWITPLTADQCVPLPTYEELQKKGRHRIGSIQGTTQYIQTSSFRQVTGVEEEHEEWSKYYHNKTFVSKVRASTMFPPS